MLLLANNIFLKRYFLSLIFFIFKRNLDMELVYAHATNFMSISFDLSSNCHENGRNLT